MFGQDRRRDRDRPVETGWHGQRRHSGGISNELKIPIRYIGIGEKIDDLREFNARDFVEALF